MRKYIIPIFLFVGLLLLFVPMSVRAFHLNLLSLKDQYYNQTSVTDETVNNDSTNNETINNDNTNNSYYEPRFYHMYGYDCFDNEQHARFLEEQKALIDEDLANGIITEEEANTYKAELDEMIQFHAQYHQEGTQRRRYGCH